MRLAARRLGPQLSGGDFGALRRLTAGYRLTPTSQRPEVDTVSAINQFPWQETILLALRGGGSLTVEEIAATTGPVDVTEVRSAIEDDIHHLVGLGLAAYGDNHVSLTAEGESAAARLP